AVHADVRMSVRIGRLAMRRPARVSDADLPGEPLRQHALELRDRTAALVHGQAAAPRERDAGGVVASILELMKALEKDRRGALPAYVAHDSAHRSSSILQP